MLPRMLRPPTAVPQTTTTTKPCDPELAVRNNDSRAVETTSRNSAITLGENLSDKMPQKGFARAPSNELMLSAATELHDGKIEDPNRLQVDSRSWAEEHIMPIIQGAQTSAYNLA